VIGGEVALIAHSHIAHSHIAHSHIAHSHRTPRCRDGPPPRHEPRSTHERHDMGEGWASEGDSQWRQDP
jgi:hypothetical protein